MLTIPEAADEIGMSRVVLWRHVNKGHLPTVEVGKYRMVDAEDLARFKAQERKPGRPAGPRRPRPPASE